MWARAIHVAIVQCSAPFAVLSRSDVEVHDFVRAERGCNGRADAQVEVGLKTHAASGRDGV